MATSNGHAWMFRLGIVALVFLFLISASPVAFAVTSQNSTVAAGYIGSVSSGTISKITAKWNIPSVTCQPALPESQALSQNVELLTASNGVSLYTQESCGQGGSSPSLVAGFVFRGSDNVSGSGSFPLAISQGNMISGSISVNPSNSQVTWSLTDVTTGVSSKFTAVVVGASTTTFAAWLVGGDFNCTTTSCSQALTHFTTVNKLTGCTFTSAGVKFPISSLSALTQMTLVDGNGLLMAKTSSLSSTGNSFKVTFVSST